MFNLKDMLKSKKVTFVKYRDGELIYATECGFEFPVPIADAKGADFEKEMNAMMFMRWVRKHLEAMQSLRHPLLEE